MPTIMILGAGIYQVPAINKAKEIGLHTIALSYLPDDPGLAIADKGLHVDTTDIQAVLNVAKQEKTDGIMTIASEVAAPTVAFVASELGLPGIRYETAKTISNKYLLRQALALHGIESIRFQEVNDVDGVISFLDEVDGPIMIKPKNSSGSKGVSKIEKASEAKEKFADCLGTTKLNSSIFVEEYIEGTDIGGGCLIRNNTIVFFELTRKCINDYFVPIAHFIPAGIDEDISLNIKALLHQIMQAFEITDGILDFDIRLSDDEPRIIELGGRLGGNCVPALLSVYSGVDFIKEGILFAIGQPNEFAVNRAQGYYTARILAAGKTGRIKSIVDPRVLIAEEDIIETQIDFNVGDKVNIFDNGANRLGHTIFKSKTMGEAQKRTRFLDNVFVLD